MLPRRITSPRPCKVEIRRAASRRDHAHARSVLNEQRAWIERLLGEDVTTVQPAAAAEYAHPSVYYAPPHGQLVVALLDHLPVGVVAVKALSRERAELKRLYVLPSARGYGIGARLVEEAIGVAAELGFLSLYLETSTAWMQRARELYFAYGFRDTDAGDFGHIAHAIGMELELAVPVPRAA
jgi:GNAT superfamily N-acetyltransferase